MFFRLHVSILARLHVTRLQVSRLHVSRLYVTRLHGYDYDGITNKIVHQRFSQVVVGREAVVSISSLGKATVGDPVDVACNVEEEVNMIMLGRNMFPNLYFYRT